MDIYVGKEGVDKGFQEPFPEDIHCHRCGCLARLMFVAVETLADKEHFICDLSEDERWLHDLCATAVYYCTSCLSPTALVNQG